jgi:hypothetical protein
MVSAKQLIIRNAFKESCNCFNKQNLTERGDWYNASLGSGLFYYDYFMKETIPGFLNGPIPDYCVDHIVECGKSYYGLRQGLGNRPTCEASRALCYERYCNYTYLYYGENTQPLVGYYTYGEIDDDHNNDCGISENRSIYRIDPPLDGNLHNFIIEFMCFSELGTNQNLGVMVSSPQLSLPTGQNIFSDNFVPYASMSLIMGYTQVSPQKIYLYFNSGRCIIGAYQYIVLYIKDFSKNNNTQNCPYGDERVFTKAEFRTNQSLTKLKIYYLK